VALVPEHGLYGTARALGVSYGALKQHVDHDGPEDARPRARFVELPAPSVGDAYVIDIEGVTGSTVRVRLNGLPLSDLAMFTRLVVGLAS